MAIYPLSGETIDPDELTTFAANNLAAFKVPSKVLIFDEPLPKNANGKVLKRFLREQASS